MVEILNFDLQSVVLCFKYYNAQKRGKKAQRKMSSEDQEYRIKNPPCQVSTPKVHVVTLNRLKIDCELSVSCFE